MILGKAGGVAGARGSASNHRTAAQLLPATQFTESLPENAVDAA